MFLSPSYGLFVVASLVVLTTQSLARSYEVPEKEYYDLELSENLFKNFVSEHQKTYTAEEAEYRHQIFQSNLKKINELNEKHESAVFGLTPFSDLTAEEFMKLASCFKNFGDVESIPRRKVIPDLEVPDHLDWRDKNLVTEVKAQKSCGSCYIFAAIAEIEGQYAKLHNELISLSEQYPLDCDSKLSCDIGDAPNTVISWLANQTQGAIKEQDYPYTEYKQTCKASSKKGAVKVKGGTYFQTKSSAELKKILAAHGPLAIAMTTGEAFHNYKGGILNTSDCNNKDMDHSVTLVGYGKEQENYWIIKNSWGPKWGENGYIRLAMDTCAVGDYVAESEVA